LRILRASASLSVGASWCQSALGIGPPPVDWITTARYPAHYRSPWPAFASRRARDIRLGGCLADEWLLKFGTGGLVGWIGEVLGFTPASPVPGATWRPPSTSDSAPWAGRWPIWRPGLTGWIGRLRPLCSGLV